MNPMILKMRIHISLVYNRYADLTLDFHIVPYFNMQAKDKFLRFVKNEIIEDSVILIKAIFCLQDLTPNT